MNALRQVTAKLTGLLRSYAKVAKGERVWMTVVNAKEVQMACRDDPVVTTLDSSTMESLFTPELKYLSELFEKHNYQLRIAGGAVRDILTDIHPKDLDFATDATPTQMKEFFTQEGVRMINTNGEAHGTITARINDKENFEVTTLRIDKQTDGRRAVTEFITDWKLDAHRRDLTINSMFLGLDGKVYDYFFGFEDLKKRRITFVGDPDTRMREDYLRILRYFRFYGRIAEKPDDHEEATMDAIKRCADGLEIISGERIWSEWRKILCGNYAEDLMLRMLDCGLDKYIGLPEKPNKDEFRQVYDRLTAAGSTLEPISLVCALLHDLSDVETLNKRLKFSAYERNLASFIVAHREQELVPKPIREYYRMIIRWQGKTNIVLAYIPQLMRYKGQFELEREFTENRIPQYPITGGEIAARVAKPKLRNLIFKRLLETWLESDFKLTKLDLLVMVGELVEDLENKAGK